MVNFLESLHSEKDQLLSIIILKPVPNSPRQPPW